MNLIRAEFSRLAARGFVRLMLVLLVSAFGLTAATTLASSHRPSSEEITSAQQAADKQFYSGQARYSECLNAHQFGAPAEISQAFPADCDQYRPVRGQLSDNLSGVFVFGQQIRSLVYFLIAFLVLFGFLVGASYIGADLNSGGMTNLLLWRPRRLTVLGTKLGTLLGSLLALSVLASVVYIGVFWLVARVGGLPGTAGGSFWPDLSLLVGRGLALALMAAALGFAIATLGRHTAAALGVIAAYVVAWEAGGRVVMEIGGTRSPDLWMLSTYVVAWLKGQIELIDSTGCIELTCGPGYTLGWPTALAVLAVVVGGTVALAFVTFRRRDLA